MRGATCIACGHQLQIKEKKVVGDLVTCPLCWSIFEIMRLDPVKLHWPEDPQVFTTTRRKQFSR